MCLGFNSCTVYDTIPSTNRYYYGYYYGPQIHKPKYRPHKPPKYHNFNYGTKRHKNQPNSNKRPNHRR